MLEHSERTDSLSKPLKALESLPQKIPNHVRSIVNHELKQLEGQSLRLPDNEDEHPHPMFLEQHREIQGFD